VVEEVMRMMLEILNCDWWLYIAAGTGAESELESESPESGL